MGLDALPASALPGPLLPGFELLGSDFGYLALLTPDGRVLSANRPAGAAAFIAVPSGGDRPFWETEGWRRLPDQQERLRAAFLRAVLGKPQREELSAEAGEAGRLVLDVHFGPAIDPSGKVLSVLLLAIDITEGKRQACALRWERDRAEAQAQALRASQARLAEAQRISHCGNWEWNVATDRFICSEEVNRIYGLAPGERFVTFEQMVEFVHPDDRARLFEERRRALEEGSPCGCEHRIVRRDGEIRIIQGRGQVITDEAGRPVRMVGTLLDVTERRSLELRLHRAQKLEALGQLTGGIAHDFSNLMQLVGCNLELIEADCQHQQGLLQHVRRAMRGVELARDLTQQLLAFARRQTLRPEKVDIFHLVEELLPLLERTLGRPLRLRCAAAPGSSGAWLCRVDPTQLQTALLNLCLNARDATAEDGEIQVEIDYRSLAQPLPNGLEKLTPGDHVVLSVQDRGLGMEASVLERVFDPFFTTKAGSGGSGLGLSMVLGFVRQSGGEVLLESEPGRGTSVQLFFPRWREGERDEVPGAQPALLAAPQISVEKGDRVLVVSAEAAFRAAVLEVLRALGYSPIGVSSAQEALIVAEADPALEAVVQGRCDRSEIAGGDERLPDGRSFVTALSALRPDLTVITVPLPDPPGDLHLAALEAAGRILRCSFRPERLFEALRALSG